MNNDATPNAWTGATPETSNDETSRPGHLMARVTGDDLMNLLHAAERLIQVNLLMYSIMLPKMANAMIRLQRENDESPQLESVTEDMRMMLASANTHIEVGSALAEFADNIMRDLGDNAPPDLKQQHEAHREARRDMFKHMTDTGFGVHMVDVNLQEVVN